MHSTTLIRLSDMWRIKKVINRVGSFQAIEAFNSLALDEGLSSGVSPDVYTPRPTAEARWRVRQLSVKKEGMIFGKT